MAKILRRLIQNPSVSILGLENPEQTELATVAKFLKQKPEFNPIRHLHLWKSEQLEQADFQDLLTGNDGLESLQIQTSSDCWLGVLGGLAHNARLSHLGLIFQEIYDFNEEPEVDVASLVEFFTQDPPVSKVSSLHIAERTTSTFDRMVMTELVQNASSALTKLTLEYNMWDEDFQSIIAALPNNPNLQELHLTLCPDSDEDFYYDWGHFGAVAKILPRLNGLRKLSFRAKMSLNYDRHNTAQLDTLVSAMEHNRSLVSLELHVPSEEKWQNMSTAIQRICIRNACIHAEEFVSHNFHRFKHAIAALQRQQLGRQGRLGQVQLSGFLYQCLKKNTDKLLAFQRLESKKEKYLSTHPAADLKHSAAIRVQSVWRGKLCRNRRLSYRKPVVNP